MKPTPIQYHAPGERCVLGCHATSMLGYTREVCPYERAPEPKPASLAARLMSWLIRSRAAR